MNTRMAFIRRQGDLYRGEIQNDNGGTVAATRVVESEQDAMDLLFELITSYNMEADQYGGPVCECGA